MMELADMQDLGDVTLGKVLLPPPVRKIEYAPVAKMVYAADLGDVTSEKVFPPPLSLRTSPQTNVNKLSK